MQHVSWKRIRHDLSRKPNANQEQSTTDKQHNDMNDNDGNERERERSVCMCVCLVTELIPPFMDRLNGIAALSLPSSLTFAIGRRWDEIGAVADPRKGDLLLREASPPSSRSRAR